MGGEIEAPFETLRASRQYVTEGVERGPQVGAFQAATFWRKKKQWKCLGLMLFFGIDYFLNLLPPLLL